MTDTAGPSILKRKFSGIRTVTLLVGNEKTPFDVHEKQLCDVSTFFKAAFASDFKEGLEKSMELPDDDLDTVELFIQWLNTGKIEEFSALKEIDIEEIDPGEWMRWFKVLVFVDKYDIPDLRKYTLEGILEDIKERGVPSNAVVEYVYLNTSLHSGTRKLMADWYARRLSYEWYEGGNIEGCLDKAPGFARDLIVALSKLVDVDQYGPEAWERATVDDYSSSKPQGS